VNPTTFDTMLQLAPMVLVFVIMYFLMIRPQQKRAQQHRAKIDAVRRGDKVILGGGILGEVAHVKDSEVEVQIAPDVRVRVLKSTLADVMSKNPTPQ
jgi:preprotein translocase subunit YajC